MTDTELESYTAFLRERQITTGSLFDVVREVKNLLENGEGESILIFSDQTGKSTDVNFRGSLAEVLARIENTPTSAIPVLEASKAKPGRPKLGVVSREVTLLPRHWEWLNHQSGGASVTLRKLVDEAKKKNSSRDLIRNSQDSTFRFLTIMAGNLSGYEEAIRALYAKNLSSFERQLEKWPRDIRTYALRLSQPVFK